MDRAIIKSQAKALLRAKRKPILTVSGLFMLLALVFSYLSLRLTFPPMKQFMEISDRFSSLLLAGDFSTANKLMDTIQPSLPETIVTDLLSYLLAVVSFGYLIFLLHALRGEETAIGMLLDGFGSWVKVLLLELLTRLIVTLGFWALVFPGFLALYNYRMARYILITNPDYGVIDCLRESRLRMRGHRMELFELDLSFLGWALLCALPLVGFFAAIWVLPYWKTSCLLKFEALVASQPAPARPDRDEDNYF